MNKYENSFIALLALVKKCCENGEFIHYNSSS